MENYNKAKFTQFELNIIELFERLQSETVRAEENGTYYTDNGYEYGYTKSALLEHCIYGINEWYSATDTEDMLNNDFILENTTDYLQLLLTLPSDTTVLAVGNGAVAAPSTTTAYLHTDYHNNKLLAVYDYEAEDTAKAMRADLCELFPQTPPQWEILFEFENADYNYQIIVEAESQAEALKKGLDIFNAECEWNYKPWEAVAVQPFGPTEAKAEAEKKAREEKPTTVLDLLNITECDTNIIFTHLDSQNIGYECQAGEVSPMWYNFKISEIYTEDNNLCVVIYE